jgi:hypothetical protein
MDFSCAITFFLSWSLILADSLAFMFFDESLHEANRQWASCLHHYQSALSAPQSWSVSPQFV